VTEHLVHNERLKLQAALLNGLAVVSIAAGFIQNVFHGATQNQAGLQGQASLSIFVFFVPVGVILHLAANMRLGDLKEKSEELPQ
jgi:uncharacterized membrane protein